MMKSIRRMRSVGSAWGQISNGKILVIVHTYKCTKKREFVRIISARMANEKESREYLTRRF